MLRNDDTTAAEVFGNFGGGYSAAFSDAAHEYRVQSVKLGDHFRAALFGLGIRALVRGVG